MSNRTRQYCTGYIEHVPAMPDWGLDNPADAGPFWHRTAAETERYIAQVERLGSTVTRIYR